MDKQKAKLLIDMEPKRVKYLISCTLSISFAYNGGYNVTMDAFSGINKENKIDYSLVNKVETVKLDMFFISRKLSLSISQTIFSNIGK